MPKPGHLAALREVIITENIQSTWTRTRVLPTIRTLILDFFRFSHCFLTKCVSAASLKMLYLLTNCDSDPTLEILTRKGKLLGNHTLKGKSHDTAFR